MKYSAKAGAVVMAAFLVLYIVLLGQTGLILLQAHAPVAKVMGGFILMFPILGLWAIYQEIRFGLQVEKLSQRITDEDAWPSFELEVRPSGRPLKDSALAMFEHYRVQAEQAPEDFHSWFNLAIAYNLAGDRRRARQSMRKALQLAKK